MPYNDSADTKKNSGPAWIAILLCVAWLLAGALFKFYKGSPNDIPQPVRDLSPLSLYSTFKVAIIVELCIAAVALIWPKIGWKLIALLFAVFIGILAMIMGEPSCGCFGSTVKLAPWHMMLIDGSLLVILLLTKPWKRFGETKAPILRAVILLPIFAASFFLVTAKFIDPGEIKGPLGNPRVPGNGDDVPLTGLDNPENSGGPEATEEDWPLFYEFKTGEWAGNTIYDIDLYSFSADAEALAVVAAPAHVILYRKSCEHCQTHIADLAMNPPEGIQVVLVRVPEVGDESVNDIIDMKPDGAPDIDLVPLERGYAITTPLTFDINDMMMIENVTEHKEE